MTFHAATTPNTLGRIRLDDGRIAIVRRERDRAVLYWMTTTHNRNRQQEVAILTAFVLWYLR